MSTSISAFTKEFILNRAILGLDSSEIVGVTPATGADVIGAIGANLPFPKRANNRIELGGIALAALPGKEVRFQAGSTSISFGACGSFATGMGVFDNLAAALQSLHLQFPAKLDVALSGSKGDRYLVMLWDYKINGSFSGSHPIGVLGSVTFGAEGARDSVYAVLHRFPATQGANTSIADTISSWRLPRQVSKADDLKPGTWLIAEAEGSLAVTIGARLGYDVNFIREAKLLGITRALGARIDAGIRVTLGFEVSGRFIMVLGRESADPTSQTVRLRLFKQSRRGLNFGLNLAAGVIGQADLPDNADDLVQAILGIHGLQVANDLHLLEQWTDLSKDLVNTVARLTRSTGLELLTSITGIDATKEFDRARQLALEAFRKWDSLPNRVSAALWVILNNLRVAGAKARTGFEIFLGALANSDPKQRAVTLSQAVRTALAGDSPEALWLAALADRGFLALLRELDTVQRVASLTVEILNDGIIQKLQAFIARKLDLTALRAALTEADFNALDSWLIARLSDFFDKQLHFSDLKEIHTAVDLIIGKRQSIYDCAREALANRYSFHLASRYRQNTANTALIDVEFDLSQPAAASVFHQVVVNSSFDGLLTGPTAGVKLNQAVLSHEIDRNATIQLHLPFFSFDSRHVNRSLATVTAEADAGRVLVYQLDANDTVTVKNRYKSQLSILGTLQERSEAFISYQSLQVKKGMVLADFEHRVTPFIEANLLDLFGGGEASLQTFYLDLDRTVESAIQSGTNQFGDVALAMEIALPAAVLTGWFRTRTPEQLKRDSMTLSRRLQAKLKSLISSCYFQEVANLRLNPSAAALLVWSAIPISTSVDFGDGQIKAFNTDKDVYWDFPDAALRSAMAMDRHTAYSLIPSLISARTRLLEAGDKANAAFFTPDQAHSFQAMSLSGIGQPLMESLFYTEAEIVRGAVAALKDIQKALKDAAKAPAKAIERLADFGADLTNTFNNKVTSVYGNDALRTLGSMLLLEASAAINPAFLATQPAAMLRIVILNRNHTFHLNDFLNGQPVPTDQIAVTQTLVRTT